MSYHKALNVERHEFTAVCREVSEIKELLNRTRVVLHGEDGTNGIKSSVDRAHSAIKEIQNHLKILYDGIASITLQSESGDKQMEIMVLNKLQELTEKMDDKEKKAEQAHREIERERATDKRWRIGQIIALVGLLIGVYLGI
ncbi:MAG: hypothetical protein LAT56_00265 [Wenzhouxiangella sp.]|nr:hypothetical protein [Wenzhouxiangella sp.]